MVGLMGAAAAVIANLVAAAGIDATTGYRETLAWTFGLTTFSFGVVKAGIAIILMGIIVRLWFRVDAVRDSLAVLRPEPTGSGSARGRPAASSTPNGARPP